MNKKIRLDLYLLSKNFVDSRQKAQRLILAGKVKDKHGKILDKPGQLILMESEIQVLAEPKFVSRGGDKLLEAFKNFPIDVKNKICLDAGISTGGFTDCLLQKGARMIYGIDVGYGQTSWKIRNNPKVKLFERTNIRYLLQSSISLQESLLPSFVVADLSFISLKLVLEPIRNLLTNNSYEGIFLIKPQFEVGKEKVSKGGVVKEASYQVDALESITEFAISKNFEINGLIASPLVGPAGNHEYLIWLSNQRKVKFEISRKNIEKLVINTIS